MLINQHLVARRTAQQLIERHVGRFAFFNRQTQAWIHVGVAAAHFGRDSNFLDKLGKNLASLGILTAFAMLNIGPFTMSGHGFLKIGYDKVSFYLGIKINSCLRGSSICFSLKRDFYTVSLIFRSTP